MNKRGLQDSTRCGLLPGPFGPEAPGLGVGSGEAPAPFTHLHLPWVWSLAGVTHQEVPPESMELFWARFIVRGQICQLASLPLPWHCWLAGGQGMTMDLGHSRVPSWSLWYRENLSWLPNPAEPQFPYLEMSRGASLAGVQHPFLPVT